MAQLPVHLRQVAMLVEVELENGNVSAALFMHKECSTAAGHSVAAFAMCAYSLATLSSAAGF
jgi:hypothetical protein